jgi:hypothetical protein
MNFSHIPKFEILGCDKTTPLKSNLAPRFSEQKRKEVKEWLEQNTS